MRTRAWWSTVCLVAAAVACGDQPTEVVPEREPAEAAASPGGVALATASTDDGLSITTDKDDYQPGDTVRLTGAGWPANDTLDILLEDDPSTHEPHRWRVAVGADGTFRDSTYIVDIGDLHVTFTLSATSRATGRYLSVVFTDGTLTLAAPVVAAPAFISVPFSPTVGALTFTARNLTTGPEGNHTNVRIRVRAGLGTAAAATLVKTLTITAGTLAEGNSASVNWDGTNDATPNVQVPEGLYTGRALSTQQAEGESGNRRVDLVVDRTPPAISSSSPSPAVSPSSVVAGSNTAVVLTARATDPAAAGVAVGHYRVLSARYQLDGGPAAGTAMNAVDLIFDEQIEDLTVTVPGTTIDGLAVGNHLFCVRATDAAGNAGGFALTGNPNCATLTITSADAQAPTIDCTVPDQAIWYNTNVTVDCTASDGSGLQNPVLSSFSLSTSVTVGTETATAETTNQQVCDTKGNCATAGPYTFKVDRKAPTFSCAAPDGTWHAADVSIACTAADGGSGLSPAGDATFSLSTAVDPNTETNNASTGSKELSDAVGNTVTAGPVAGNRVDKKAPTFSCDAPDNLWHALDVSISCRASDGGSGVSPASDANFSLSTTVAPNTETNNAATGSKAVADVVGNTVTAGPITGNWVDKKAPVVTFTTCPASTILIGAPTDAVWSATDNGSGVDGTASGNLALETGTVGKKTAVSPAVQDKVGNTSGTASCEYSIAYGFLGLSAPVDPLPTLNSAKAGQAIPLKWRLTDYQGNPVLNFSNVGVAVTNLNCAAATGVDVIEDYAGNSGLQNLGDGYYQFNWKTPAGYANSCKSILLNLGEGTSRGPLGYFQFKK